MVSKNFWSMIVNENNTSDTLTQNITISLQEYLWKFDGSISKHMDEFAYPFLVHAKQ